MDPEKTRKAREKAEAEASAAKRAEETKKPLGTLSLSELRAVWEKLDPIAPIAPIASGSYFAGPSAPFPSTTYDPPTSRDALKILEKLQETQRTLGNVTYSLALLDKRLADINARLDLIDSSVVGIQQRQEKE